MSRINEKIIVKLGLELRLRRESLLYSQKDVAYMTGLTINTIARIEKGKGTTLHNFLLICRALNLQPRTLFEYDIDLTPLNAINPDSKHRIEVTQRLDKLVNNSTFFDTPRRVSDVITELESDQNDSNKFSVYLTGYCQEDVLEYEKVGNYKRYKKKSK